MKHWFETYVTQYCETRCYDILLPAVQTDVFLNENKRMIRDNHVPIVGRQSVTEEALQSRDPSAAGARDRLSCSGAWNR